MTELVRTIAHLETLALNCCVDKFPIDAIRKHGSGLRVLEVREYDGMVHLSLRENRVPTLSLRALLEVTSCCPNIMELALDLEQGIMVRKALINELYPKSRSVDTDRKLFSRPVS